MTRSFPRQYQQRLAVAMTVYVATMLLVWPQVQHAVSLFAKVLLATAPALPMLYVIGLMAGRIMRSDELEQRTHLLALGVVSAVVAGLSLIGGFLSAAGVLKIDPGVLIWIFPLMMVIYGLARWWVVTRTYGGDLQCESGGAMPWPQRLLMLAAIIGLIVAAAWWRGRLDDTSAGMLIGMLAGVVILGLIQLARVWWRRASQKSSNP